MSSKIKKFAGFGTIIYVLVMAAFAAVTFFLCGKPVIAAVEGVITLGLGVYALVSALTKRRRLTRFVESVAYDANTAKNSTLVNFPLPVAAFRLEDAHIVWGNEQFFEMCGAEGDRLDAEMTDYVPQFSAKWLFDGKTSYGAPISVNGRQYALHGNIIRAEQQDDGFMGITYWIDVTDYENIRTEFENTRPVAGIVIIDNLDELYRNQPERVRNDIRDSIEDKLNQWGEENHAILRRYERDRYITVLEQQNLDAIREDKFPLVEEVHAVESPSGIPASISVGMGEGAASLGESFQLASNAAELALSRGGDQAVVKNKHGYEFFGGRGTEVETRTKVKSRVMANALADLIRDSGSVFVMGHKYADLDCVGAAAGIVCLAGKLGAEAYIVIDAVNSNSGNLIDRMKQDEYYAERFITPHEAMIRADSKTLLVLVDTNRPEQTEDRDLLEACTKVVVIDHHRVGATYVENAALNFVEPYSSSASELVTELLQEIVERHDIRACESEALLAGMVLDTKSFTVRTGERTFEAAAYLRRAGADTSEVKKLLQSDMDTTIARYNVLRSAKLYRNIALAAPTAPQTRVVAAQAADELLNISGVDASVVIAPDGRGGSFASARSIGDVNVQILMERLGGGGNRSVAAAQFESTDITTLYDMVKSTIDDYFDKG